MALEQLASKIFSTKYMGSKLNEDITEFFDQLSLLLENGVAEGEALELMRDGWTTHQMAAIIKRLHRKVSEGSSLVAAMSEMKTFFTPFYVDLLIRAERDGELPKVLKAIATHTQMSADTGISSMMQFLGTLIYPIFVTFVVIIVTIMMLIFVIPQFESLYAGFGAELPSLTRHMLTVSHIVGDWWYVMLVAIIVVPIVWLNKMQTSAALHGYTIRLLLMLPGYGGVYRQSVAVKFLYSWALMIDCGYTLREAVAASGQFPVGPYYQRVLGKVGDNKPLHAIFENQGGLFSKRLVRLLKVSEHTDIPQQSLRRLAEIYHTRVGLRLKTLHALHRVFVLVIIGFFVGSLVIALYLPIFKMGEVMS